MRVWAVGAVLTAFLAGTGAAASPVELPTGAELVYSTDRVGDDSYRLHLLSSTGERRLTRVGPSSVKAPSWSPVRRELAFSSMFGRALWLYDVGRRSIRLLARADADAIVWSPEGDRLAIAVDDRARPGVTIVHRADGRLQRVPLPAGIKVFSVAWAPDGRRLLVAGDWGAGSSLVVTQPQRPWQRIGPRVAAATYWGVTWSPDGRSIAFGTSSDEIDRILILAVSTGRVRRFPAADQPTWAPDSHRLAVTNDRRVTVYDIKAGTRRTYPSPVRAEELVWAADGRSLVVSDGRRLYAIELATALTRRLTRPRPLFLGRSSRVSSRGESVAVVEDMSRGFGSLDLFSLNSRRTRLVEASDEFTPRWLDRWRLVFEREGTIVVLDLRTRRERRLGAGAAPLPSPDGTAVLVQRGNALALLSPSGAAARTIGAGSEGAWSPDSRRVAYVRGDNELFVLSLTGDPERLLASAGEGTPCPYLGGPAWSPDGNSIAFHFHGEDEELDSLCDPAVFAVPAAGGAPRPIMPNAFGPEWSPDGARLLVQSGAVVVLSLDGRRLASWPGRGGVWSPDGHWIAYHSLSGDLWIQRSDGTQPRRVALDPPGRFGIGRPAWRPAGP